MAWLYILWGSFLLYLGGEILIKSASKLALALGWSSLLIGLTVVALGTSAPELAATLIAAFKGMEAVALGNIVGSNIANVSLVLGSAALIIPLKPTSRFVRQELPFMIFTGMILFLMLIDGHLGRAEALLLFLFLSIFLFVLFKRDILPSISPELLPQVRKGKKIFVHILGIVLGVVFLSFGADVLIDGAVILARRFGLSQRIIGLTLVALGTSLPELASTLVAAYRGAGQIILGNLIGSNIMNVLAVLACTSLIRPLSFPREKVFLDLSLMMAFFLCCWGMLSFGQGMGKIKGFLALVLYLTYIFFLYHR